jgi:hypothetical protein
MTVAEALNRGGGVSGGACRAAGGGSTGHMQGLGWAIVCAEFLRT